ncbi:hypothetical protein JCM11251_003173 [Rhodosporidiobolus azoricus]
MTPALSPALAQAPFRHDAGTSRGSLAGGAAAAVARNGMSPPRKKRRKDGEGPLWQWGLQELMRRREEVLGKAKAMALEGALRIELILEKKDTLPALLRANLPTHRQHLHTLIQPDSPLNLTLEDYLSTFVAWSTWTADVEVATFPITGALVAYFLIDRVPSLADRPSKIYILEQYRKATAEAFDKLSNMSMPEITAQERRVSDSASLLLHKFDWVQWKVTNKEAGKALQKWKAIEELAPVTSAGVHHRSASGSTTPAPSASTSSVTRPASAPHLAPPAAGHPAPVPAASQALQGLPPALPHSYQPTPLPTPSTSQQPVIPRPPVIPSVLAHPPPPLASAPARVFVPNGTLRVKAPGDPLVPPDARGLTQAAAPLTANARGKQRAVDQGAVTTEGQVSVAVRQLQPQAPVPVHLVAIAPAPVPIPPAPVPLKRQRRVSAKALAEVELPAADQAEENAFFAAARELQDALAEFTTARHMAANRLGQVFQPPRAAPVDTAHAFSDYTPLPAFLDSATFALRIPCFDTRDGLNALRPPPRFPAKPQHLEITSQPLPPASFVSNFMLVGPHFMPYPEALQPILPASIPSISGYAFSLGQETTRQLYASFPTAAQQYPHGSDAYEVEVRKRLADTARRSILAVKMKDLPQAREPAAAREAMAKTAKLLALHEVEQDKLRERVGKGKGPRKEVAGGETGWAEQIHVGEKVQVTSSFARPLFPHTSAEPNFPSVPYPPARKAAAKTPSHPPAALSPASASLAPASRPLHRPSLGTIASAPAVPGTRPRSGSAGMGRRPSLGGGDIHPLLKIYANAPNQVRSFARAKAAEIKGVPSDEVAAGLAKATERMSQSPMLGHKHLRLANGHSPLVGTSVLPAPGNGGGKISSKHLASVSMTQNAVAGPSRPRMASPPLVPIPLAPVEEVADGPHAAEDSRGGFEGGNDVEMAELQPEERAEPPVPTGETALGVIVGMPQEVPQVAAPSALSAPAPPAAKAVSSPADSSPLPMCTLPAPVTANSAALPMPSSGNNADSPTAAISPSPPAPSSFGSHAQATVGAFTSVANAPPSGLTAIAVSPPSGSEKGSSTTPTIFGPNTISHSPTQPVASTFASPIAVKKPSTSASRPATPVYSASSSRTSSPASAAGGTPILGVRGPRKCGVCGSGKCPGRGGRQWCTQGKSGGGAGRVGRPASPAASEKGKGKGKAEEKMASPAPNPLAVPANRDKGKGKALRYLDIDNDGNGEDSDEEVVASLGSHKRSAEAAGDSRPSSSKQHNKDKVPVVLDKTKYPNPIRSVPKAWLAVSDPVMPFSMLPVRRNGRSGSKRRREGSKE